MTVTWGTAREFQRLLERRDLAAYRAVVAIGVVLDFWEAQDYDAARTQLERAHNEFKEAEARIAEFKKSPKGETRHGHRTAAR